MEEEPEAYVMPPGNGSSGRFIRIENKLDKLTDRLTEGFFVVDHRLTVIETRALAADDAAVKAREDRGRKGDLAWVKYGLFTSVFLAILGGIVRIVFH